MASDTDQTVKTTERPWSEEVAISNARAGELVESKEDAYVFSNGRRFVDPDRPG